MPKDVEQRLNEDPLGFWMADLAPFGKLALARAGLEIVRLDQAAEPLGNGGEAATELATGVLKAVEGWIAEPRSQRARDAVQQALSSMDAQLLEAYDSEDETGWSLAHLCKLVLAPDAQTAGDWAELVGNCAKDVDLARQALLERLLPGLEEPRG